MTLFASRNRPHRHTIFLSTLFWDPELSHRLVLVYFYDSAVGMLTPAKTPREPASEEAPSPSQESPQPTPWSAKQSASSFQTQACEFTDVDRPEQFCAPHRQPVCESLASEPIESIPLIPVRTCSLCLIWSVAKLGLLTWSEDLSSGDRGANLVVLRWPKLQLGRSFKWESVRKPCFGISFSRLL